MVVSSMEEVRSGDAMVVNSFCLTKRALVCCDGSEDFDVVTVLC